MSRDNGPLVSIVLWYGCAAHAFPSAAYVGKADDDVWLHLPNWAAYLRGTLPWLRAGRFGAYVGTMFEGYHWRPDVDAPVGWRHMIKDSCRFRAHNFSGPFSFAIGPSFFLSAPAAREIAHATRSAVMRTTGGDRKRCLPGSYEHKRKDKPLGSPCEGVSPILPAWDDVWTGWALASVPSVGPMVYLSAPEAQVNEYGLKIAPSTISWHGKIDNDFPRRAQMLDDWMASTGKCEYRLRPTLSLVDASGVAVHDKSSLVCQRDRRNRPRVHRTCAGQEFLICQLQRDASGCNTSLVDLSRRLLAKRRES